MSDEDIQAEIVLEHYREPRNYGKMENPTVSVMDNNPVCGDTINLALLIENDAVKDVKFLGRGCSISQASASMLTEKIAGKPLSELEQIKESDIIDMVGLKLGPSREKCALLSYNTLQKCIREYRKK